MELIVKTKQEKSKTLRQKEQPLKEASRKWILRLYIAGNTPKAVTALNNLKSICKVRLKGKYYIKVIDLLKNPQLGRHDQIFAIPTLTRKLPQPVRYIIGDLSNTERVLEGLNFYGKT